MRNLFYKVNHDMEFDELYGFEVDLEVIKFH